MTAGSGSDAAEEPLGELACRRGLAAVEVGGDERTADLGRVLPAEQAEVGQAVQRGLAQRERAAEVTGGAVAAGRARS